jgi:hypothetical protein
MFFYVLELSKSEAKLYAATEDSPLNSIVINFSFLTFWNVFVDLKRRVYLHVISVKLVLVGIVPEFINYHYYYYYTDS